MKIFTTKTEGVGRLAVAALIACGLATGPAWGQEDIEVAFPGTMQSAQLFDANSALMTNPVGTPPSAIHWKWDRVRTDAIMQARFPRGEQVISPLTVEGHEPLAEPPLLRIRTPDRVLTIEDES